MPRPEGQERIGSAHDDAGPAVLVICRRQPPAWQQVPDLLSLGVDTSGRCGLGQGGAADA